MTKPNAANDIADCMQLCLQEQNWTMALFFARAVDAKKLEIALRCDLFRLRYFKDMKILTTEASLLQSGDTSSFNSCLSTKFLSLQQCENFAAIKIHNNDLENQNNVINDHTKNEIFTNDILHFLTANCFCYNIISSNPIITQQTKQMNTKIMMRILPFKHVNALCVYAIADNVDLFLIQANTSAKKSHNQQLVDFVAGLLIDKHGFVWSEKNKYVALSENDKQFLHLIAAQEIYSKNGLIRAELALL